jgi:phosphoenolpyruvate carboxykinase (GTP)
MPTLDGIDLPDGFAREDIEELLKVDAAGWKTELSGIRTDHYAKFGSRLPKELMDQLDALEKRLT